MLCGYIGLASIINFLQCIIMFQKLWKLVGIKQKATINRLTFLAHPVRDLWGLKKKTRQNASTFNNVSYSLKGYAVQTIGVVANKSFNRLFDDATFVGLHVLISLAWLMTLYVEWEASLRGRRTLSYASGRDTDNIRCVCSSSRFVELAVSTHRRFSPRLRSVW